MDSPGPRITNHQTHQNSGFWNCRWIERLHFDHQRKTQKQNLNAGKIWTKRKRVWGFDSNWIRNSKSRHCLNLWVVSKWPLEQLFLKASTQTTVIPLNAFFFFFSFFLFPDFFLFSLLILNLKKKTHTHTCKTASFWWF